MTAYLSSALMDLVKRIDEISAQIIILNTQISRLLETPTVQTKTKRSKKNAKANEDADIDVLIAQINSSSSEAGKRLRADYMARFSATLAGARRSDPSKRGAGGRKVHFDFQINVIYADGRSAWLNVEHKGSKIYAPINKDLPPWTGGVQFYNGGMEKYRLARKYAEDWHSRYIKSGLLKSRYGLVAAEPDLETWIAGDARVQGAPKTPFGSELKTVYQARPGCAGKSLSAERDEFVEMFYERCDAAAGVELAEDIYPLVRDSLAQKDVWLQVAGDVNGAYYFAWSPPLRVSRIDRVEFKKGRDIEFTVYCDNDFKFNGILRWGYGAGFSNLRCDLR